MHILITGGTGAIGRRLVDNLIEHGHVVTVISRKPFKPAILPAKINFAQWDGKTAKGWGHLVNEVNAIVNLAGAGIADGRWTDERKKLILESRINAGNAVIEAVRAAEKKPQVLIQASAVGYYGSINDQTFTESSPPGDDFLAKVCKEWEASTQPVEEMGVRRVIIRTGVVLDPKDGALPKMIMPFKFFAGGPIGNGQQWFPWIHYRDEVEAIRFLIENDSVTGPVNLTAPRPVRNRDFAWAVGKAMKRPALIPTPGTVFKVMFGEMSTVLLDGQQAIPHRLTEAGYQFKFTDAKSALEDLLP